MSFDLATILKVINIVSTQLPAIETTVGGIVNSFKQTTAPTPTTTTLMAKPDEAVRGIQRVLNLVMKPQPPLKEDGFLGEKTDKAINDALALAQPYLEQISALVQQLGAK